MGPLIIMRILLGMYANKNLVSDQMILAADQNMKNASASEKIAKTRSHTAALWLSAAAE
jgi:hypothetical protein